MSIIYLFLSHLGIGIAFTLLLVSKEAGVKFFRFNAGLAAALLAAALAFRPTVIPDQAGVTSTVLAFTSTGSPVLGSRISAKSCSAPSTSVQSTSSLPVLTLIHGVVS